MASPWQLDDGTLAMSASNLRLLVFTEGISTADSFVARRLATDFYFPPLGAHCRPCAGGSEAQLIFQVLDLLVNG